MFKLNWTQGQRLVLLSLLSTLIACSDTSDDEGIKLADGSTYHGEMRDGLFHGKGQMKYLAGSRYQGDFEDGIFHGEGNIFFFNGDVYRGEFHRGAMTGKGVYTTSSGVLYEGDFFQGKASGEIKLVDKQNGYSYEGQMLEWKFSGNGLFTRDSEVYQGEFKENLYDGLGVLHFASGGEYKGEFSKGQFNGLGVYEIDGDIYSGQFADGEFSGFGVFESSVEGILEGQFEGWDLHGKGRSTDAQGNVIEGNFEGGYATGDAEFTGIDGRHYRGEFRYGRFDGAGVLTFDDGRRYEGEFSYGQYHGQGKLVTPGDTEEQELVQQGRWEYGSLVYNDITKQSIAEQAEIALEKHQTLLDESITGLLSSEEGEGNLYFLGVAGDGTQSVFRREVEFVSQQLHQRYGIAGRAVHLVNDHDSAPKYPLATTRSFAQAVEGIATKMDKENDVLFVYLTSHGSQTYELALGHDSINLPGLSAVKLGEILKDAKIKRKVVIVSACYSGGFMPELDDESTLIMTASDAENSSFGCSDDSDMTYFGKALFSEVLANDRKISLQDAFYKARDIVSEWEKEQELTPSNPQMKEQQNVADYLQAMQKQK